MPAPLRPIDQVQGKQAPGAYRVSISAEPPQRQRLSQRWVREVVRAALSSEGAPSSGRVEVLLAGDRTVQRLNASYLGEDHVTDVLSFPGGDDFPGPAKSRRELGQIVLSLPQAARQAREAGRPLPDEAAHLLVHGVLHLLGHDHMKPRASAAMRAREEEILQGLAVRSDHVHSREEA